MTVWICAACGIEHANTARPPARCAICTDERQYVPAGGQAWTSLQAMAGDYTGDFAELEPNLYAVQVKPSFAIGQRGLLIRTPAGNVLWEPPGYVDQRMIDTATELGGVAAIASSHPHLVGCSVTWSKAFDGVPVYYAQSDRRWIRRPDDVIRLWSEPDRRTARGSTWCSAAATFRAAVCCSGAPARTAAVLCWSATP